jgi:hypothetical protein
MDIPEDYHQKIIDKLANDGFTYVDRSYHSFLVYYYKCSNCAKLEYHTDDYVLGKNLKCFQCGSN